METRIFPAAAELFTPNQRAKRGVGVRPRRWNKEKPAQNWADWCQTWGASSWTTEALRPHLSPPSVLLSALSHFCIGCCPFAGSKPKFQRRVVDAKKM